MDIGAAAGCDVSVRYQHDVGCEAPLGCCDFAECDSVPNCDR